MYSLTFKCRSFSIENKFCSCLEPFISKMLEIAVYKKISSNLLCKFVYLGHYYAILVWDECTYLQLVLFEGEADLFAAECVLAIKNRKNRLIKAVM